MNMTIVDDKEVEGDEAFRTRMTITAVDNPKIISNVREAFITIYDDDCMQLCISHNIMRSIGVGTGSYSPLNILEPCLL